MNQRRTDIDKQSQVEEGTKRKKNDLIVITGAGGFIAGNLVLYFKQKGFTRIRAVDKKQLGDWYLRVPQVESLSLDCTHEDNCHRVCEGAVEVYNLAADMGGMGFIERFRVACQRSTLEKRLAIVMPFLLSKSDHRRPANRMYPPKMRLYGPQ